MWLRLYNVLEYSLSLYVFKGSWTVKIMISIKQLSDNIIDLIRRGAGFVTRFDAAATFEQYMKPCGQGNMPRPAVPYFFITTLVAGFRLISSMTICARELIT